MDFDFSRLFHQSSKSLHKGHPPIPKDSSVWPEEWKTTYYKTYPRLQTIPLGEPETASAELYTAVRARKSGREFSGTPVNLKNLSNLLYYSAGNMGDLGDGRKRRAHPSGGGRFPIDVYPLIIKSGGEIPPGLYHYNIAEHGLDVLWERPFTDQDIDALFSYEWVKNASLVFLMTATFWRNQNKYGERGYRYVLIEAGHIGQNLYLVANSLGLTACALGGTKDAALEKLIDIDGVSESLVYAIAIG